RMTGRTAGRHVPTPQHYLSLCEQVHDQGMYLKVNTVVHRANWLEDMSELIAAARPQRWKLMQVLQIGGQNSDGVGPLLISDAQFDTFVQRHMRLASRGIAVVPERNADMIGSYAMV